jgi:hypothetical protein
MTATTDLTVANTIAEQIGARAFQMMGTRIKCGDANSLRFDIRGCTRGNRICVTLDANDTYTVQLLRVRGLHAGVVAENEGVYNDGLRPVIEGMTGLHLSL